MTNPMQDKELMDDVLTSQKMMTSNYSIYANECAGQSLRTDMLNLLREEHEIQADLFYQMQSKGWYPTPPAEQQKINQTKQKFSQCAQKL
ncbi:MAG: spore coat protein [Lachnospiraceae bacterium]|nr:spore coat protein [Lachnospiraceae bacterium]